MRVLHMPVGDASTPAFEFKELEAENHLDGMKALVGGWIEIVRFRPRLDIGGTRIVMVVDDEGLVKGKPINWGASALYGTQLHGQYIHGDVFLAGEIEGPEGADLVDFPQMTIESVRSALTQHVMSLASVPSQR